MMEKLGVNNKDLIVELQKKYNQLKENERAALTKESSERIMSEMQTIRLKIDELQEITE